MSERYHPTERLLVEAREAGWSVAIHNDYRLNGVAHVFWLLTHPNGRWVKGEGRTDAEALTAVVAAITAHLAASQEPAGRVTATPLMSQAALRSWRETWDLRSNTTMEVAMLDAINAALALVQLSASPVADEVKPVAWVNEDSAFVWGEELPAFAKIDGHTYRPLYSGPQAGEWQPMETAPKDRQYPNHIIGTDGKQRDFAYWSEPWNQWRWIGELMPCDPPLIRWLDLPDALPPEQVKP